MSIYNDYKIKRRKTRSVMVGNVPIGSDHVIAVQSMTNTLTSDSQATIRQVLELEEAGADIVRVSCPDEDSTKALKDIVKNTSVPIVADIHFHYKRALESAEAGASCLRINPGNIGSRERIAEVVKSARDHNCSIRIGVNAGSLEKSILDKYKEPCPDAMVESALNHAKFLQDEDFHDFKISVKASNMFLAVDSYRQLAKQGDFPLHLGITEAGSLLHGTVLSSAGLGMLLSEGIGDTIRVSLSADPVEEVKVAYSLLRALNLRHRGIQIISCPTCARQGLDVISTVKTLEKELAHIKEHITISIIGCVVNGPGEAKYTQIGITGGNADNHMLYLDGNTTRKIHEKDLIDQIIKEVEQKANELENK